MFSFNKRYIYLAALLWVLIVILQREINLSGKEAIDLEEHKSILQAVQSLKRETKYLHSQLQFLKKRNDDKKTKQVEASKDSIILANKIDTQLKEMWYYLSNRILNLKSDPSIIKKNAKTILEDFGELHRITEYDFNRLVNLGRKTYKSESEELLSSIIQERLFRLQHPVDCNNTRKLVCSLQKPCGYTCKMHFIVYCFMLSYATERTLIINSSGLKYSTKSWEDYFKPASNCTHVGGSFVWDRSHNKRQVIKLVRQILPQEFKIPQMPLTLPKDVYSKVIKFHKNPSVWWIGQFIKHLFKYQDHISEAIKTRKEKLGFKSPIVGIHVRRTDKITAKEAAYHSIEEYMNWVELYYKKRMLNEVVDVKRVFIATDDISVLSEARRKYPEYTILSSADIVASATERGEDALHGIISDIDLLSETDYLVCTFSSGVCRMAYEMMNSKHVDASQSFHSLDDLYYFTGQSDHKMKVILEHTAHNKEELSLKVGDVVKILGNHWNGQAKVIDYKTNREGFIPAYKLEDIYEVAQFPTYNVEMM